MIRDLHSFVSYLRHVPRLSCLSHKLLIIETLLEGIIKKGSLKEPIEALISKAGHYRQILISLEEQINSASQYSPLYIVKKYKYMIHTKNIDQFFG